MIGTSKSRFVGAYLGMVGVPILVLLGVLRTGRNLVAPLAVHGKWLVINDLKSLESQPCGALLAETRQPALAIDQSGNDLTITLNNPHQTTLPAKLQGAVLTTSDARDVSQNRSSPDDPPDCSGPKSVHIDATLSHEGQHEILTGKVILRTCPQCPPLPLHAVRWSPPRRRPF